MLFQVQKPNPAGIYWLDTVLTTFFNNLFGNMAFGNAMFPPEFENVLTSSPKTLELFRAVFSDYQALEIPEKQAFQNLYTNHRVVIYRLSDDGFDVVRIFDIQSDIWKSLKELGKYLYTTTLGLVAFTSLANVNHNINDHFEEFKSLNGNVCCFCGLKEYEEEREIEDDEGEVQWRADYDHYLPKKHYPFSAINFDNLFPICHTCNSKAKGEIDILYAEDGIREIAFHPYLDGHGALLVAIYDSDQRKWELDFAGGNALDNRKIENWDRIFKVISRAKKQMNDFCISTWVSPLIMGFHTAGEVRASLQFEAARCMDSIRNENAAYYKALCYLKISKQDDLVLEDLLSTVTDTYEALAATL